MADSTPAAEALTAATNQSTWAGVANAAEALMVLWLQPLNVLLIVMLVMFARFMHKANQRADFSLVDALKGPDGKASMKLIGYLVGIMAGTYVLFDCAASWLQQPMPFVYLVIAYLVLLIAPKIAAEWVQAKYRGGAKEEDRRRDDERRPGQ